MQQYYGTVSGRAQSEVSRIGTKDSGLETVAYTKKYKIHVILGYNGMPECDIATIVITHVHSGGLISSRTVTLSSDDEARRLLGK